MGFKAIIEKAGKDAEVQAKKDLVELLDYAKDGIENVADHVVGEGVKVSDELEQAAVTFHEAIVKEKAKLDAEINPPKPTVTP
jgi:Na+/phosphate symporter